MQTDHAQLMAVLNATPDSLYGGVLNQSISLNTHIKQMLDDGADIIDVGGESTAPDSAYISAAEEWNRIEQVLKILKTLRASGAQFKVSLDSYKSEVLQKALELEVTDLLNDVTALRGDSQMAELAAKANIEVCLVFAAVALQADGSGQRTNNDPLHYEDVIKTIGDFWQSRIDFALKAGITKNKIILDPGMGGFVSGDPKYSFEILNRLDELRQRFADFRILVGPSRKGFTGIRANSERLAVGDRLEPSLAAAAIALYNGVDIIRAHDVKPTRRVIDFMANFSGK